MNLKNIMLSKRGRMQKINTVWFHLREVQEQATLISAGKVQNRTE